MPKCLAFDTPEGVMTIRPNYNDRTVGWAEGEEEVDFLRRVLARNVEVAAQITRSGKPVNPYLTAETPVYVVEDVPPVLSAERAAWKIPPKAERLQ